MAKSNAVEYIYSDAEYISNVVKAIEDRQSFVVFGVTGKILKAASDLERLIEERKFSCRVYTLNRAAAAIGVTWTVAGSASWLAIASHNLFTFNPDYEIGKDIFNNKLYIKYKKTKRDEKLKKKAMKKQSG